MSMGRRATIDILTSLFCEYANTVENSEDKRLDEFNLLALEVIENRGKLSQQRMREMIDKATELLGS